MPTQSIEQKKSEAMTGTHLIWDLVLIAGLICAVVSGATYLSGMLIGIAIGIALRGVIDDYSKSCQR